MIWLFYTTREIEYKLWHPIVDEAKTVRAACKRCKDANHEVWLLGIFV